MQKDGLISREPNPADARSTLVCLLPVGRAAIEKAAPGTSRTSAGTSSICSPQLSSTCFATHNERILQHLAATNTTPRRRRAFITPISLEGFSEEEDHRRLGARVAEIDLAADGSVRTDRNRDQRTLHL